MTEKFRNSGLDSLSVSRILNSLFRQPIVNENSLNTTKVKAQVDANPIEIDPWMEKVVPPKTTEYFKSFIPKYQDKT